MACADALKKYADWMAGKGAAKSEIRGLTFLCVATSNVGIADYVQGSLSKYKAPVASGEGIYVVKSPQARFKDPFGKSPRDPGDANRVKLSVNLSTGDVKVGRNAFKAECSNGLTYGFVKRKVTIDGKALRASFMYVVALEGHGIIPTPPGSALEVPPRTTTLPFG